MSDYWREIPGWEGFYEVSYRGEVRSMTRRIPNNRGFDVVRNAQLRRQQTDKQGYKIVPLSRAGNHQLRKVHQLVLEAFVGPRPFPEAQTLHINGDSGDNRLENLKWGTAKENGRDKSNHGSNKGHRNGFSKLTPFQAFMAFELKLPYREIAEILGVKTACVKSLKRGVTWSWL
jgi:hypothetical protein